MPCKDTTSQITVILDENDCLVSFDFSKLTCHKPVGGGTGYMEFCRGKPVDQVTQLEFSRAGTQELEWRKINRGQ